MPARRDRRRDAGQLKRPRIRYPGVWPRSLPCLGCDRLRLATAPSDRMCKSCRTSAARVDGRESAAWWS